MMEIYSYVCNDGSERWGYRIYTDATMEYLSIDAAGFESEDAAEIAMKKTLEECGWE